MPDVIKKKYVIIKWENEPICVLPLHESDLKTYQEIKVEANKNMNKLLTTLGLYEDRITNLEKEVKHLKGED